VQTDEKECKKRIINQKPVKKIIIVGLPNTGKSQVFNNLTGEYTIVANYPLTTVEVKRTHCRLGNQTYEVIDTPGLHCLYIHSEEELIVRDLIFSEKPDVTIQCIDANQLKQSLILTADLLELGIPMVISLNAIDETNRRGIWIDSSELSRLFGVPVVELMAVHGQGTKELKNAISEARRGIWGIRYGDVIENVIFTIDSMLPEEVIYRRKVSVLMLLSDPFLADYLKKSHEEGKINKLIREVSKIRKQLRGNPNRFINSKRSRWVDDVTKKVIRKQKIAPKEFSKVFARLCRHPLFGIPILAFFILSTYLLVVQVAGFLEGQLSANVVAPSISYISTLIESTFWNDFLVGHYGILSLGLFNALCTVLPILSVFFLMFGFLEDIGYIVNLCVLTKRIFEKVGLTGKSIMPLVLGFGCKTMATLVTRGLRSPKEKFIAVYLIAFAIPCSAQLGIAMGILGRIGFAAFLIAYGALILFEMGAGFILNKIIKEQERSYFIQELPAIRAPNAKAILIKTYYRLYWFLKEAVPIFIIAAVVLFLFDKTGILNITKKLLSPVIVGWLNLPLDIVDALILCMARHEAAAALILNMVDAGALNYVQCIVAVVITTMFVPCFANIVAICKEMGVKTGLAMTVAINLSSFVLAGILNWILISTIGSWAL